MACRAFNADGFSGIICGRFDYRDKRHWCSVCGRPVTVLCDYQLPGGKTCDAPLCELCAKHVGQNTDYCPQHATAPAQTRMEEL